MHYVDGVVCAVPTARKQAYLEHAERSAEIFERYGALQVVECWGDDVPEGKVNSLHTAVHRKPDETIVFSWIVWPSKAVRDEAWEKAASDPEMTAESMPYDGQRMIYGGFEVLLDRG